MEPTGAYSCSGSQQDFWNPEPSTQREGGNGNDRDPVLPVHVCNSCRTAGTSSHILYSNYTTT